MLGTTKKLTESEARAKAEKGLRNQLTTEQHAACHRGGPQLSEDAIQKHVDTLLSSQHHQDTIGAMANTLMNPRSCRAFSHSSPSVLNKDPAPATPTHTPSRHG